METKHVIAQTGTTFPGGTILRLNRHQAERRRHRLRQLEAPPPVKDVHLTAEELRDRTDLDQRLGYDPRADRRQVTGLYEVIGDHSGQFKKGEVVYTVSDHPAVKSDGQASLTDQVTSIVGEVLKKLGIPQLAALGPDVTATVLEKASARSAEDQGLDGLPGVVADDGDEDPPDDPPEDLEARADLIRTAAEELRAKGQLGDDPPKVAAITKIVGFKVSRQEIDQALAGG